jgi:hypothetical protein
MTTQQQLNKELVQELTELREKLAQKEAQFHTEKNIKNFLYFFILSNDLVALLKEFQQANHKDNEDYYIKSLEFLVENAI